MARFTFRCPTRLRWRWKTISISPSRAITYRLPTPISCAPKLDKGSAEWLPVWCKERPADKVEPARGPGAKAPAQAGPPARQVVQQLGLRELCCPLQGLAPVRRNLIRL